MIIEALLLSLRNPRPRSQNVCFVNLEIKHWSPYYADMRIDLIPLRYPVVVISCRDNLDWGIKHLSSKFKSVHIRYRDKWFEIIDIHFFIGFWKFQYTKLLYGMLYLGQAYKHLFVNLSISEIKSISGSSLSGKIESVE